MSKSLKGKVEKLEKRVTEKALGLDQSEEILKLLAENEEWERERAAYWDRIGLTVQQRAEIKRREIDEFVEWYRKEYVEKGPCFRPLGQPYSFERYEKEYLEKHGAEVKK